MPYLIGHIAVQGTEPNVLAFPTPKPGCPGADRWATKHQAERGASMGDLVMLRADVVDTSPCDLDPCAGYVAPAWDPA